MHKYINSLFVLLLLACQSLVQPVMAQEEKTLKESWGDLKKSFHPDKAFTLPFNDSTNEDLKAFLFEVQQTKGVHTAVLKMDGQKAIITVDAKGSMVSVWNNLPKEIRNRYTVEERTPQGFILSDSYQKSTEASTASNGSAPAAQKQNTTSVYEQAEQDAAKNYKNPDTTKRNKSIWQQQKDYAEQMRQRDHDWATGHQGYTNPANYDDRTSKAKGSDYIEYKINGNPFAMYNNSKTYLTTITSRISDMQEYTMRDIVNNKQFVIKFTNPAMWPEVRKFELGKPGFKTTRVGTYSTEDNRDLYFALSLRMMGTSIGNDYNASGHIGFDNVSGDNIVSGTFEILYFEPGIGGIVEAKFSLVVKGGKSRDGKPQPDLIITDGRLRARMKN